MSDEEKVVSWLEENYKGLIVGVIIGLSILYGYKAYISNENTKQLNLSREYDHLELKEFLHRELSFLFFPILRIKGNLSTVFHIFYINR